jgi:hypothetical protein
MEVEVPQNITYSNKNYLVTIQVHFEPTKPVNATLATVIQEAVQKNLCHKCKDP